MTSTDREQLRLSLLRFLDANPSRFGLGTQLLFQHARAEGRPALTVAEVDQELRYLLGKGLIEEKGKMISPENRSWGITAAGRDLYAELSSAT